MSYTRALGAFESTSTYASGTQVVGGFQVIGLPSANAGNAVQLLREAVAAAFPMGSVAVTATSGPNRGRPTSGWGAAFGVPAGRLYVVITTNVDGVTGPQINTALSQVARALSGRLNGLRVNLTNAHTTGGAAPLPALTPDTDPSGNVVPGGSLSPLAIGGIAVGGLVVVALGVATFAFVRRPVARNRRPR